VTVTIGVPNADDVDPEPDDLEPVAELGVEAGTPVEFELLDPALVTVVSVVPNAQTTPG